MTLQKHRTVNYPENLQFKMRHKSNFTTACLFGYHGMQNAGDDAFFSIMTDWMCDEFGVESIEVFGNHEHFPEVKDGLHVGGIQKGDKRGIQIRLCELTLILRNSLTVYAAGSLFQRRDFLWLFLAIVVAKCWGWVTLRPKKIAAIGVSLGPFHSKWDRFWGSLAFSLFDLVLLRDKSDDRLLFGLKNSRLLHGNDLALTLKKPSAITRSSTENPQCDSKVPKHVGFAFVDRDRHHGRPRVDDEKRMALLNFLDEMHSKGEITRVTGMVFCNHPKHGDVEVTTQIVKELTNRGIPAEIYPYHSDTNSYLESISELDLVVGNRMHSFIFALICGTPAISIAYEPKIIDFAHNCGLPAEIVIPIKELSEERLRRASRHALSSDTISTVRTILFREGEKQTSLLKQAARLLQP